MPILIRQIRPAVTDYQATPVQNGFPSIRPQCPLGYVSYWHGGFTPVQIGIHNMIDAPLHLYHDIVRPQWIDYNRHMTEGYYAVVFGNASDAFIDYARMDATYREERQGTIYTVETHLCFLREVKEATPLYFTTQLLGCDAKRMHVFHQMWAVPEGNDDTKYLAATFETMMLHVNQDSGRVSPFPADIHAWLEQIHAAHATLPWPEQVGRAIHRL